MKITAEVIEEGGTKFVETFYDLPNIIPNRPLALAREVEKLMVAYPEYQAIIIQIEKDDDGTHVQKPPTG